MRRTINTTDAYGKAVIERPDEEYRENQKPLMRHRGYEKFFAGYTEYTVTKPNGRKRIERIYTGRLYKEELNPKERAIHKLLVCVWYILAVSLLVYALVLDAPSNHYGLTSLIAIAPLVVMVRILFLLMTYIPAGEKLTIHEFRDGANRLPMWALVALAAEGLLLIVSFVYMILNHEVQEFLKIGIIVWSMLCMLFLYFQSKRVGYKIVESKNTAPQGGVEINVD